MLDLGEFDTLPDGEPTLRKAEGQRFVCVREGNALHVLDDRCPHEGYPLSGGAVRDGVLTCCWHNWKFELSSGACTFGGEAVRRYPAEVSGGRICVHKQPLDPVKERTRIAGSLAAKLRDGSFGSVMREGLRLESFGGEPLAAIAEDAAGRAPYGFEHGLAALADVARWTAEGQVDPAPALAAISVLVGEPLLHAPPRPRAEARSGGAAGLRHALEAEQRAEAEGIARRIARDGSIVDAVRNGLAPWLSRDLTDYGHGVIFTLKALELTRRYPSVAEEVFAALVVTLGWSTFDSALPGWGATHQGIAEASAGGEAPVPARPYLDAVLDSERSAVRACLNALDRGAHPNTLLRLSARAAAVRLGRFDDAWEGRTDAPVTALSVSHALTFAEAALSLPCSRADRARFAVQSAAFVGKLRQADRTTPGPRELGAGDLPSALRDRDLTAALHASNSVPLGAFASALAEHALHRAYVRPIFATHAVKTAEACFRLERLDPEGRDAYRRALLTLVVPRRPERFSHRTAAIAARFVADPADGGGRPPPGLY
ncbi:MAG: Rieske (2Fe-2S) protein [Sandaracinaceae bacterium]